jgi:small GTP-binding protein
MSFLDRLAGRVSGLLDDVLLPDDVRSALVRAQKALATEDYEEVIRLLEAIRHRPAGAARIDELRGLALLGLGQLDESVAALESAAKARPSASLFLQLGEVLLRRGDLEDARRAFRESLEGDSAADVVFGARRGLAQVYLSRRRADRACRELRKALAVGGTTEEERRDTIIALSEALLAAGRLDDADQALAPLAGTPEASVVEGRLLQLRGRPAGALERFDVALSRDGTDSEVRLLAARSALDLGDADRAEALLEGASGGGEHGAVLGRIALMRGDASRSLEILTEVLCARPNDLQARDAAGWASLALGDVDGASDHFHHLLSVAGSSPEALLGLGECHVRRGELDAARRTFAAALSEGAGVRAAVKLGEVLVNVGEPAVAVEVLTGAQSDAANEEVASTLEQAYASLASPIFSAPRGTRDPALILRAARDVHQRIASSPRLHGLLGKAQTMIDALDAPLDVAILGEFNAGKSTLVNAILGEEVVPTGVLPTTAHIDVLRFGPRRAAQLHLVDGGIEEIPLRDVKGRVKGDDGSIDHIEYLYPHPVLRRVHFWDTPGFNAIDDDHERRANEALSTAEAIVWVMDATQALTESERDRIAQIHDAQTRLVVVLNKTDRLDEGQVVEVRSHVAAALGEGGCVGVFAVSALEAARGQARGDDATVLCSGLPSLVEALEEHVFDRAGAIKCGEGERALDLLRGEVVARASDLAEAFEAASSKVAGVRDEMESSRQQLLETFVPREAEQIDDAMALLVDIVLREMDETARAGSRLVDALFVRPRLDSEDMEFLLAFMEDRHGDVLQRSRARVDSHLRSVEAKLTQGIDGVGVGLPPSDKRLIGRHVRDFEDQASGARRLLTERVQGRYGAIAQGRMSVPGAAQILRGAARTEDGDERRRMLRTLLPEPTGIAEAIGREVEEYFDVAGRFFDTVRAELNVMVIEARALATGLEATE